MPVKPGDIVLNHASFKRGNQSSKQWLCVRKLTDDGKRAVVHQAVFPAGMVNAVDVRWLIVKEGEFWRPCAAGR